MQEQGFSIIDGEIMVDEWIKKNYNASQIIEVIQYAGFPHAKTVMTKYGSSTLVYWDKYSYKVISRLH